MLNKDKRGLSYPKELASQFILRLPDGPARVLKELLRTGDDLGNRLTIHVHKQMKYSRVRLDHWKMRAEIVDLPIITDPEQPAYKGPQISQMLICTLDEERSMIKNESVENTKKDDTIDDVRKFMWPHGVVPPSRNNCKRPATTSSVEDSDDAPDVRRFCGNK